MVHPRHLRRTLFWWMNKFDAAKTDRQRKRIRKAIRRDGYRGLADTIGK